MRVTLLTILFISVIAGSGAYAQTDSAYTSGVYRAIRLYQAGQYQQSAETFTLAFVALGGHGYNDDRYTAACSWALSGNKDSAFYQLQYIATKGNFRNTDRMTTDDDLESLHSDPRWDKIYKQVAQNKAKSEDKVTPTKMKKK